MIRIVLSFFMLFLCATPVMAQDTEYQDIPDAYIYEAQQVFDDCQKGSQSRFMNCECLSVTYLDARIAAGEDLAQSNILLNLDHDCYDAAGIAGYHYNMCLNSNNPVADEFSDEVYCSCYANAIAEIFDDGRLQSGTKAMTAVGIAAFKHCQKRESLIEAQQKFAR